MADEDLKEAARKALEKQKKDREAATIGAGMGVIKEGSPPSPGSAMRAGTYTVSEGDNPTKIAKILGVTLKELQDANPNMVATKLKIGSNINVPKKKKGDGKEKLQPATLEQHKKSGIDAAKKELEEPKESATKRFVEETVGKKKKEE